MELRLSSLIPMVSPIVRRYRYFKIYLHFKIIANIFIENRKNDKYFRILFTNHILLTPDS